MSSSKFNADECFPGNGEKDYEVFGLGEDRAVDLLTRLFKLLESNIVESAIRSKTYSLKDAMVDLYDVEKDLLLNEYGWVCYCATKVLNLVKTKFAEDKANNILKSAQERLDRDVIKGDNFKPRFMRGHEH